MLRQIQLSSVIDPRLVLPHYCYHLLWLLFIFSCLACVIICLLLSLFADEYKDIIIQLPCHQILALSSFICLVCFIITQQRCHHTIAPPCQHPAASPSLSYITQSCFFSPLHCLLLYFFSEAKEFSKSYYQLELLRSWECDSGPLTGCTTFL